MELVADSEERTEEMNGGCCCGLNWPNPGDCAAPPNSTLLQFLF